MSSDYTVALGGYRIPFVEYDLEHSKVEAWLDEHPEFFQVRLNL